MDIAPHQDQSPIFIYAPTARCGVTLMQRLLTSTKDVLIFGENRMLTGFLAGHLNTVHRDPKERDATLERMASGDVDFWASSVSPLTMAQREWAMSAMSTLATVYQYSAQTYGFKRWGIKEPMMNGVAMNVIAQFFPKSRFVMQYRNLRDVLRSYKSRQWLKSLGQVDEVSRTWANGVSGILQQPPSGGAVTIKYEDLLADKEKYCKRLETRLDLSPIKREVFDTRVNTFKGEEEHGHAPKEYIKPKDLTEEEKSLALKIAGEVLEKAGYSTDWS